MALTRGAVGRFLREILLPAYFDASCAAARSPWTVFPKDFDTQDRQEPGPKGRDKKAQGEALGQRIGKTAKP
jgi:hypothetical protein